MLFLFQEAVVNTEAKYAGAIIGAFILSYLTEVYTLAADSQKQWPFLLYFLIDLSEIFFYGGLFS